MRGKGAYFVVLDEVRDWKKGIGLKEAWEGVIQPCIITRWSPKQAKLYGAPSPGRSLTISTPKGYDYLYDMSNMQDTDKLWRTWNFDYRSSPMLDEDEIDRIKDGIDPLRFAREYKASFKESGNSVFYCFDRTIHLSKDIAPFRKAVVDSSGYILEKGEDVHVCIDFNVSLQCSASAAVRNDGLEFIDEFMGHPDTAELAKAIVVKYWPEYYNPASKLFMKKLCDIYVYPDPTGRSRKTSAAVGVTDFSILEAAGLICRARTSSPPIVDSVAAVNRLLKSESGKVRMKVSTNCQGVTKSLERTAWMENNPDTAMIDKKEGVEHYSDGVRYISEFLYPVSFSKPRTKRSNNF